MLSHRDLALIPVPLARRLVGCPRGSQAAPRSADEAAELPAWPDVPTTVSVLASDLGRPLLAVSVRLSALASQAPPPLRAKLLAEVDEIDTIIATARELLLSPPVPDDRRN